MTQYYRASMRRGLLAVPRRVILLIIVAVELLPILWMITTSFSQTRDIIAYPPRLPLNPTFANYAELVRLGLLNGISKSLITASCTIAITFVLGSPFAYLIAK